MIKRIVSETHWCTFIVLVIVAIVLICVTFGVVSIFCCMGVTAAASAVTYRMLMTVTERQKSISSSAITDIVKKCNVFTTTTTATKKSSTKASDSRGIACGLLSEDQFFDERNSCARGGVMFEVNLCVQYIMRDFVVSWYQSLSPNEQFTCEIQYALEDLSIALVSRARKLGMQTLLHKAFCVYHWYFINYLEALTALRDKYQHPSLENCLGCTDAVQECFTGWHYALSSPTTEMQHLHNMVNVLLEVLVPADVLSCGLGRKLVVTLLVHKVLLPLVDVFTNPHWLNQKIIALTASPKRIAAMEMDSVSGTPKPSSENKSVICSHLRDTEDSGVCFEGSSLSLGSERLGDCLINSVPFAGANESFDLTVKPDTLVVEPTFQDDKDKTKDKLTTKTVSPSDATEGIWQRMAGELPAAFRSERDQEVSELVQEASASIEKKKTLKIPLSGSLERISDILSNTISFESISNNLAQYFKLGTDDSKPCASSQPSGISGKRTSGESDSVDNVKELSRIEDSSTTILSKSLTDDKEDGEDINPSFHVSSVLERMLPMTTGPVLSEQLLIKGSKTSLKDDLVCSMAVTESVELVECTSRKTESPEYLATEMQQHSTLKTSLASVRGDSIEELTKTNTPESNKAEGEQCSFAPFGSTFMNLAIVSTEIVNENQPGASYIVYCIKYDAWYHDPNSIQLVDVDHYVDILEPHTILQKGCVRRRFREFVTLHNRLEEDPKLRPLMKGIKGPNKWQVLPFKLDKEAIADRKQFLENYLQILVSKEEISGSNHLREFLAYGNDPSIAYVRKATDAGLPVPRIDKFLMRTVTGVFDKLKTALPSLPHDPSPVEPTLNLQKTSDRLLGFLNFTSALNDETSLRISFDFISEGEFSKSVEEQLGHFLGTYDARYDKVDAAYEAGEMDMWIKDPWSSLDGNSSENHERESISAGKTASSVENTLAVDNEIPLASAILNLIVDTVQSDSNKVNKERFIDAVKIIVGPLLERWVNQLIDTYSSEAMFAKYLKMIREVIWHNGVLLSQPVDSPTDFDKGRTYNTTLQALNEYFPSIIALLLGRTQYEKGMKLFLDSLQHPKLLRHLVYHLMDLLVDVLLVRSRSQSLIEKLGSYS